MQLAKYRYIGVERFVFHTNVLYHDNKHPQIVLFAKQSQVLQVIAHSALHNQPQVHPSPSTDGLSWYAVPEPIKQWLTLASAHWHQPEVADGYMKQALALAGGHPDVLVSAYRYFFYTHNYPLALQIATSVMQQVQADEALPSDWELLRSILRDRHDDPIIRLYINAYAASGLIRARLGELDAAKQIALQVSEIETRNEFGGNVVRQILEHPDGDEEDEL